MIGKVIFVLQVVSGDLKKSHRTGLRNKKQQQKKTTLCFQCECTVNTMLASLLGYCIQYGT